MSTYIKIIALVMLSLTAVGCASGRPPYSQPSPMIDTVKESGYKSNTRRTNDSVRYDPYTTLGSSVKQAGEVHITITFEYTPGYKSREARTGKCLMHIKSSDTSLADVKSCKIDQVGNTFMVRFRGPHGEQSFDLKALGGVYDGPWPVWYTNTYVTVRFQPSQKRQLRYSYVGPDPLK